MGYVMVPVPAELVDAVERYLRWGVGRKKLELDADAMAEILEALDDEERRLVGLVARRVLDEMPLTLKQIQAKFGWNSREIIAAMLDINQHAAARGDQPELVAVRASGATDDVPGWFGDANVMVMEDHIAQIVVDLLGPALAEDTAPSKG